MKILGTFKSLVSLCLVGVFLSGCAVQQDQFGYAVMTGNLSTAKATLAPNYARMQIQESNGQYSVPIQYAIIQKDRQMADFLLENGAHTSLKGRSLAYYCGRNGYSSMGYYFAKKGYGSSSEVSKGLSDLAAAKRREAEAARRGTMIALGVLAFMMSNSGGGGGHDDHDYTNRVIGRMQADGAAGW